MARKGELVDRQKKKARYAALRDEAAITLDGVPITLMINAGLRSSNFAQWTPMSLVYAPNALP